MPGAKPHQGNKPGSATAPEYHGDDAIQCPGQSAKVRLQDAATQAPHGILCVADGPCIVTGTVPKAVGRWRACYRARSTTSAMKLPKPTAQQ